MHVGNLTAWILKMNSELVVNVDNIPLRRSHTYCSEPLNNSTIRIVDFGCRIIDIGYRIVDVACRIVDIGYRIVDIACRFVDIALWS